MFVAIHSGIGSDWGLGFKDFLGDGVVRLNTSDGRRSLKRFITEGRWDIVFKDSSIKVETGKSWILQTNAVVTGLEAISSN